MRVVIRSSRCRRSSRLLATFGLVAAALLASTAAGAQAPESRVSRVDAVASANGVRVTVVVPGQLPVDTLVDGGGPTAQVLHTQIDGSQGFASFPYPGDTIATLPTTMNSFGAPRPPDYPLYVSATFPGQPQAQAASQGYSMEATASEQGASASASAPPSGESVAGVASSASVGPVNTGQYLAEATSVAQYVAVGPLVLSGARAFARVTQPGDGAAATVEGTIEVASASIAGVPIRLDPQGLDLGDGTVVPMPVDSTLASILDDSGVSVQFVSSSRTDHSVVSGAIVITREVDIPGAVAGRVTYVIGAASASASPTAERAASTEVGDPLPTTVASTPVERPGSEVASGVGAAPGPTTGQIAAAPARASLPAPVSAALPQSLDTAAVGWFYAMVAGSALLVAACSHGVREIAVRRAWLQVWTDDAA